MHRAQLVRLGRSPKLKVFVEHTVCEDTWRAPRTTTADHEVTWCALRAVERFRSTFRAVERVRNTVRAVERYRNTFRAVERNRSTPRC